MTSLDHLSSPSTGRAAAPGSPPRAGESLSPNHDDAGFATVLHDVERRPADAGSGAVERDELRDAGDASESGTEAIHAPAATSVPPTGHSTEPTASALPDRGRVATTVSAATAADPDGSVGAVTGDPAAATAAATVGDADAAPVHQDPQPPRAVVSTVSAEAQRPAGTSVDTSEASTEPLASSVTADRRSGIPDRPSAGAADRVEVKVTPPATNDSDAGAADDLARPDARPPDSNPTRTEAVRLPPGLTGPDRAAEQLAWRELFDRIDRHRLSNTGALELEIATERFGLLRVEAAEGRDGVHLSLRGDEASHRELADLADELRQQFGREGGGPTDVDVGEEDTEHRPDDDPDIARASPATDTGTESTTTEPSAGDTVRSALDLRL